MQKADSIPGGISPESEDNYLLEAEAKVAALRDPELKRIAFQAELERLAQRRKRAERWLGYAGGLATVIAVCIGIFSSIAAFNDAKRNEAVARDQEALARQKEAEAREAEAMRPFIEMKRQRYVEILQVVGTLAAPDQDPVKTTKAKRRFWELYWAELTLVEDKDIEKAMKDLGALFEPNLKPSELQGQTYRFAHLIRQKLLTLETTGK